MVEKVSIENIYNRQKLKDKRILLYFEGVYMDTTIYVNGHYIGHYPNGYMPFYFYIDEYLYDDCPNRLEVHVNHQQPSSRWYSGSGIYRDVSLFVLDKHHFYLIAPISITTFKQKHFALKQRLPKQSIAFKSKLIQTKRTLGSFHFEENKKKFSS